MATRKRAAKPKGSHTFSMRIPSAVWEKIEAAATRRGVSVASLMLQATAKEIGLA